MAKLSQLVGGIRTPVQLVNGFEADGAPTSTAPYECGGLRLGKLLLSGALTANTWKPLLTITGSGRIKFLATGNSEYGTSKGVSQKLVLDGETVFESTSTMSYPGGVPVIGAGRKESDYAIVSYDSVFFGESLEFYVKTNVTGTDVLTTEINYEVY